VTFDPTTYHLSDHGDSRQRKWAKRILSHWPHYETLWQHYIVPLTFQIKEPGNYFIRPSIAPEFEDLADTQYAVFFHLAQMHEWCVLMDNRGDAKYLGATEALYAFFSHGTSMLDATVSFAAAVDAVIACYDGTPRFGIEVDRWGNPVLGDAWGMAGDRANWHGLVDRIKAYRNLLVHRRPVFMQNAYVPKAAWVDAMSGLTAVSRLALEPDLLETRYEPVVPMMRSLLEGAGVALDGVWAAAVGGLGALDQAELGADLTRIAKRDRDLDRDTILALRGRAVPSAEDPPA